MDTAYLLVRGCRADGEFMVGAAGALVAGIGRDLGGGSFFLFEAKRRQGTKLANSRDVHGNQRALVERDIDPSKLRVSKRLSAYFFRAASNSSPGCQPCRSGAVSANWPNRKPNRAMAASPVKSMSARYSSLVW